jgi:hypothetical protein
VIGLVAESLYDARKQLDLRAHFRGKGRRRVGPSDQTATCPASMRDKVSSQNAIWASASRMACSRIAPWLRAYESSRALATIHQLQLGLTVSSWVVALLTEGRRIG